jgi:uncharacterized protein
MREQENLALVRQGYEAFGRADLEQLLNLLDPQVNWITSGPADLPIAGTRRGRAAVAQFFGTLLDVVDMLRFEPQEFIAHRDKVVVLGTDTVRVKATGRTIDGRWAHVVTVLNGKIVEFESISDVSALVAEVRAAEERL